VDNGLAVPRRSEWGTQVWAVPNESLSQAEERDVRVALTNKHPDLGGGVMSRVLICVLDHQIAYLLITAMSLMRFEHPLLQLSPGH
jgi:hypothetical protein